MKKELLTGERVIRVLKPHPLSFWPYYAFWLYFVVVGALILWKHAVIVAFVKNRLPWLFALLKHDPTLVLVFVWALALIIPALLMMLVKVSIKWVVAFILIVAAGIYAFVKYGVTPEQLLAATIGLGILGIVLSDIYRRSHTYILTNWRIITKTGFFGLKTRDVLYSRLTDVSVEQGILGRIFNYGTVYPLTASGLGTGEEFAKVAIAMGGGKRVGPIDVGAAVAAEKGRAVRVPKGRTWLVLYGVPKPHEVRKLILERMVAMEPTPVLEEQTKLLRELVELEKRRRA